MSENLATIKHNKHRIHPCPKDKKLSLLNFLITQNQDLDIIIAAADDTQFIKEAINHSGIKILNDKELLKLPELKCDLLISYDLPSSGILYMARLAKATQGAIVLLDKDEQKQLYPIETLLGRVIRQEVIKGFEYQVEIKKEQKEFEQPKKDSKKPFRKPFEKSKKEGGESQRKPFDEPKYNKPKRDADKPERKGFDKPKYDKPKRENDNSNRKPYDKSIDKSEQKSFDKPKRENKKPNKFLGKDENGKAIFSGKSGERNHRYDGTPRDKQEAPKKEGRKISIKERKPKE